MSLQEDTARSSSIPLLALALGVVLFAAMFFGSDLWKPSALDAQKRLSLNSQVSQRDVEHCLLKDWGGRLLLQPSWSPDASSTVRLHNPVSGIVVDLIQRSDMREVVAYAPKKIHLTPKADSRDY